MLPQQDQLMHPELQSVLHDLRTPLNQIIGFSEMLQEIADDEGRQDLREGLGHVCEAAIELTTLLGDARLISFAVGNEADYWRLVDASRTPISRVLGFADVILAEPVDDALTAYAGDILKIRNAAVQFISKVRDSNIAVRIEAVRDWRQASLPKQKNVQNVGRVLIVDDENLNREILCRRLQREGYSSAGVSSGEAALEILEQEVFDIILLDIIMPGIGGIDVLQRLKQDSKLRHLPVLMLSALTDVDRVARCVELGAEDYLPKPVNAILLRARLGACIEKKRLRDQDQASLSALNAEKKLLSVTIQSLADAVVTTDQNGQIILFNNVAVIMTGFSETEARGKLFSNVFPIFDRATDEVLPDVALEALDLKTTIDSQFAAVLRTSQGERLVATHSSPIHHPDGGIRGTVVIIRDVTEKEKITSELLRSSKLESIGVLAGGLAHDFNNMLTAIVGNLSLIRHKSNDTSEIQHWLDEAEMGALRARDLAQHLLTFSEGGAPLKKIIDVGALIQSTTEFVVSGSRVDCKFNLSEDLWKIEADPSQLSQAISNIVINAEQAMPNGGVILIKAENVSSLRDEEEGVPSKPGIAISISDTGVGITQGNLSRIYDPFFTTRNQARGLGLAAAYSIIHRHSGTIEVQSSAGEGSKFTIFLPARPPLDVPVKEVPRERPEPVSSRPSSLRRFKVLLMDDEASIRMACESMLDLLGYDVVPACDGMKALELFNHAANSSEPFDLFISDLTVPGGMGGAETMRQIREMGSHIPSIVSSGYSNGPVMSNPAEYGFDAILPKPYRLAELETVLKKFDLR